MCNTKKKHPVQENRSQDGTKRRHNAVG